MLRRGVDGLPLTFEGKNPKELKRHFIDAVEEYLRFCEVEGKKPDVPYKGSLNVRLGRDLHMRAALLAEERGQKLNKIISDAVEAHLNRVG